MKPVAVTVISLPLLFSVACSSNRKNDPSTGPEVAIGVTALVLASPAIPVVNTIRKIDGKTARSLAVREIYQIDTDTFAIPNTVGWFLYSIDTPMSQRTKSSAWVINLESAPKDRKGRIILDRNNLDPDYFDRIDRNDLKPIQEKDESDPEQGFYYKKRGHTIYIESNGKTYPVMLTQQDDKNI